MTLNLLHTKNFNYLVFRNVQNFIHTKFLRIWYAMGTRDLPDIYTLSPQVYISGKPPHAHDIIAMMV